MKVHNTTIMVKGFSKFTVKYQNLRYVDENLSKILKIIVLQVFEKKFKFSQIHTKKFKKQLQQKNYKKHQC